MEGNGQSEITEAILGTERCQSGKLIINAKDISIVPDDRIGKGMIKEFSIGENVMLRERDSIRFDKKTIREKARDLIDKYDVRLSMRRQRLSRYRRKSAESDFRKGDRTGQ